MRFCLAVLVVVGSLASFESRGGAESSEGLPTAYDQCNDTCRDGGGGLMYCVTACTGKENTKIDAELNATYRILRNRLKGSVFEKQLVIAERQWIRDRDKRCKEISEADYNNDEDKSAGHQDIAAEFQGCIQDELRSRLEFLKDALSRLNKEGIGKFHL